MIDLSNTTIAVTGAGGFIGHSICRKLYECGAKVRMLVRYRSDMPGEYQFDLANNILDPAALESPVRAVVHCAWDMKTRKTAERKRTNVDGSQWLAERCQQAGVEQFIFVSSLAAHPHARSTYGKSKWEVEKRLQSLPNGSKFSTTVAPGLVIGNGGAFFRVRAAFKKTPVIPKFYGFSQRRLQTVFIDELCDAIVTTIANRTPGRLLIAEQNGIRLNEFYRAMATLDGKRKFLFPFSGDLAVLVAGFFESLGFKPPVSPGNLLDLRQLNHVDVTPSYKLLGCPPVSTFWQSLERLAIQENKPLIAEKIRMLAT